jgi:hypothetical protein
MITVPGDTPVTIPVVDPIDAMKPLELLHVPPVVASANVVVKPWHTLNVPAIGSGDGLTVKSEVTKQPVGSV